MNREYEPGRQAPRIAYRDSFLVAGLCDRYSLESTDGIADQWRRFGVVSAGVPRRIGAAAYGVMLPVPGVPAGFDYLTGVEVADRDGQPGEFSHAYVPAGTYAVFEHRGHVSGIKATWQAVHRQWLPDAGLEIVDASVLFEQYGADFDPETAAGAVALWVPVSRKAAPQEK